jgi:hypothetical protein
VAGEPQPQIDIHKAVSRIFLLLLFILSFEETTTELELDTEGLTETVLHLNLGFICFDVFWFLGYFVVCLFCFFPFDETTEELFPRHQYQDWRMKE